MREHVWPYIVYVVTKSLCKSLKKQLVRNTTVSGPAAAVTYYVNITSSPESDAVGCLRSWFHLAKPNSTLMERVKMNQQTLKTQKQANGVAITSNNT